jgi:hypothetical protein
VTLARARLASLRLEELHHGPAGRVGSRVPPVEQRVDVYFAGADKPAQAVNRTLPRTLIGHCPARRCYVLVTARETENPKFAGIFMSGNHVIS